MQNGTLLYDWHFGFCEFMNYVYQTYVDQPIFNCSNIHYNTVPIADFEENSHFLWLN